MNETTSKVCVENRADRRATANAIARVGAYYLGRMVGRNRRSLAHISSRTVELCPRLTVRARTPYFDRRHLSRIRPSADYSTRKVIEEHLFRRSVHFQPLLVHWLDDAWIVDGSLFARGAQRIELRNALEKKHLFSRFSLSVPNPVVRVEHAALVGTCAGSTWFGHWLEDEVPLHLLGSMYAPPVAQLRAEYSHERGYLNALHLPAPTRVGVAECGTLVVVEEFAQNPHKTVRYQIMRRRLGQYPKGKQRVFLLRGKSGTPRNLVNEHELARRLEREGFYIVDVANQSFEELLAHCLGASIVVGVEGSHLAHALFMMNDYGSLLILNPPNRVVTTVADIGVFCRLFSGMFVGTGAGNGGTDFLADPDEVLEFLDQLLSYSDAARNELAAYVDEVVALAPKTAVAALA